MQFNLILLIGCRVGKRNTGQQAELAGTLNSAGFYGTVHLGILQGHSPLDAEMLVKSNAGFFQQY